MKKKILVLVPAYSALGGIKNYYRTLEKKFTLPVIYMSRGSRSHPFRKNILSETFRLIKDLNNYVKLLKNAKISLIHVNTSLSMASMFRDGLYLLLAKCFHKKRIVFFRGWSEDTVQLLDKKFLFLFKFLFFHTNAIVTLTDKSKKTLERWGYKNKIFLETTLVDENLLNDFDYKKKMIRKRDDFVVLFLARLQKEKGIYELIDAHNILCEKYSNIKLVIAGSGTDEMNLKKADLNKKVKLTGHIEGEKKSNEYANADVYVLPSYTEGMPNSVLEAMAFGLPIICTSVGALSEIIGNEKNGYVVSSANSQEIADYIEKLYLDPNLLNSISQNNYIEAKRFYSSCVVKRLEQIYLLVLNTPRVNL